MGLERLVPSPIYSPGPRIPTTAGLTVSAAGNPVEGAQPGAEHPLSFTRDADPGVLATPGYMLLQARLGPNRMSCNWTRALSLAPLWEPGTELSLPRAAEGERRVPANAPAGC